MVTKKQDLILRLWITIIMLLVGFFFYTTYSRAATHYVDFTGGNDSNVVPASPDSAWKTIAKVNAHALVAGDIVLFKRGETWHETLTYPASGTIGNPIVFASYGASANQPIIDGSDLVTGWTALGGNKFSSHSAHLSPQQVFLDGTYGNWKASVDSVNAQDRWTWTAADSTLTIYTTTAADTSNIKAGQRICVNNNYKDYVTIRGIELAYGDSVSSGFGAGLNLIGAIHCMTESLTVHDCYAPWGGIRVYTSSYQDTVRYCIVYNNRCPRIVSLAAETAVGIELDGSSNNLITYNTIHDNGGCGIQTGLAATSDSLTISHNTIYNNGSSGITVIGIRTAGVVTGSYNIIEYNEVYSNCLTIADRANIDLYKWGSHNIVRYNKSYNANYISVATSGIRVDCYTDSTCGFDNWIYYNVCYNDYRGMEIYSSVHSLYVYNNVFYGQSEHGIWICAHNTAPVEYVDSVYVKNNIFHTVGTIACFVDLDTTTVRGATIKIDYNSYFNASADYRFSTDRDSHHYNFANWQAKGFDTHGMTGNPAFTDSVLAGGYDFSLSVLSPCIAAGADVGLTTDYLGNPIVSLPDIGAEEYQYPGRSIYAKVTGTGDSTGASWTNAFGWAQIAANTQRGDTIWVADGTYPKTSFSKSRVNFIYITVKKATVADHGIATGWSDAFGDGVAEFTGSSPTWTVATDNWIFDGQSGTGTDTHGFKITTTSTTSDSKLVTINAGIDSLEFYHIEFQHAGCNTSYRQDIIYNISTNSVRSIGSYWEDCYFHDTNRVMMYLNHVYDLTINRCYFAEQYSATGSGIHAEMIDAALSGADSMSNMNWIIKNSVFKDFSSSGCISPHDGIYSNCQIYNNIFYQSINDSRLYIGSGMITNSSGSIWRNFRIYNNTFYNIRSGSTDPLKIGLFYSYGGDSCIVKNNLVYGQTVVTINGLGTHGSHNYNASSSAVDSIGVEANNTVITVDPFLDKATFDFHLRVTADSLYNKGTDVGLTADMRALLEPQGSGFPIGAYELYESPESPSPVTGVTLISGRSSNAIIGFTPDASHDSVAVYVNGVLLAVKAWNETPVTFVNLQPCLYYNFQFKTTKDNVVYSGDAVSFIPPAYRMGRLW